MGRQITVTVARELVGRPLSLPCRGNRCSCRFAWVYFHPEFFRTHTHGHGIPSQRHARPRLANRPVPKGELHMSEKPSVQRSDAAPSSASAPAPQPAAPAPAPAGASQSSPQTSPSPASLKVANPERLSERIQNVYDNIARRAFEMFERDGWSTGRDLDH